MTPAERKLWYALRAHRFHDLHLRRQVPMGRFIADFASHTHRTVIEVDGGQHGFDRSAEHERERAAWFASQGYRVLRFWNGQVLHEFESVLDTIYARTLEENRAASADEPSPPLWGRVGEGGFKGQARSSAESHTAPSPEAPASDARQPPSGCFATTSPTRGEG